MADLVFRSLAHRVSFFWTIGSDSNQTINSWLVSVVSVFLLGSHPAPVVSLIIVFIKNNRLDFTCRVLETVLTYGPQQAFSLSSARSSPLCVSVILQRSAYFLLLGGGVQVGGGGGVQGGGGGTEKVIE